MLQSSDTNFKELIKIASKNLIQLLCKCFLNVVNGNAAINEKLIDIHEKPFGRTLFKQV